MQPALLKLAALGTEDRLDGESLGADQWAAREKQRGIATVELYRLADRRIHQLGGAFHLGHEAADMRQVVELPQLLPRPRVTGGNCRQAQKRRDDDAAPAHNISPGLCSFRARR